MSIVTQPSAMPTNKLTVAVLIPLAVQEVLPMLFPALAATPNTTMLIGAVLALVVGWLVPDRA